jgi:hypothetical protein
MRSGAKPEGFSWRPDGLWVRGISTTQAGAKADGFEAKPVRNRMGLDGKWCRIGGFQAVAV